MNELMKMWRQASGRCSGKKAEATAKKLTQRFSRLDKSIATARR